MGDEIAFSKLVTPLFDRLYGFSFSVTKSETLAEEVVQDVLVKIWEHRQKLPELENLAAWVYTVTRNRAYNTLRQQLKQQEYVDHLNAYFALAPGSPEERLLLKDSIALLQKAKAKLPPRQEEIFTLSRMEGLTLDEIADQLSLSKETVKKHLTLALKSVRSFVHTHSENTLLLTYCLFAYGLLICQN